MTTNRAASSRLERSVDAQVEIILHPIPTADSKPYIVVFGPDRQLWFCESGTAKIGRMNPGDGSFVEFDTPTPDSRPIGITPAADGALWFCENAGNRIGRITTAGWWPWRRSKRANCAHGGFSICRGPSVALVQKSAFRTCRTNDADF